ncbi:MAG TPA: sigma 54-interacting transcriptional regulator [Anaeromyxobacteraceae bacterium]|nr:sigma 54-interacting transcriptional regulator [Anaeromyxobacteraceae bacterium]
MKAVLDLVRRVAPHEVPILLVGESGSGKTVLARILHSASKRSEGPFIVVDCLPLAGTHRGDDDVDVQGAETVIARRTTEASGGTLVLDEVSVLPRLLQAKVGQILERGCREGRGVRIVALSRTNLEAAVQSGRFREELLRRINVVQIRVPAVRQRREDILPLARAFLDSFASKEGTVTPALTPAAEAALLSYSWPGNVRELRNAMQRAVVLSSQTVLDLEALPQQVRTAFRGGSDLR